MSEKQTYAELKKRVQQLEQERSELRSLEELLRESHQVIEGILNAIPVRVFWKDRNLIYMGCNKLFARDAGFVDPEDIIGKDDYQIGWRDQAELYRKNDREVIESGDSKFLIEEPQTTPEGNTITLLTSKIPLRSATGAINGVLGTYMDITDRKRAEEALRESESSMRAITDSAQDAILMMDTEGRISYWNPAAERIFGHTSAEAIGQDLHTLIVPSHYHEAYYAALPVFQQKGQGAAVG